MLSRGEYGGRGQGRLRSEYLMGSTGTSGMPDTTRRQATTIIMCKDGETMLCGGLTLDEQTITSEKTPILGDLPLVGKLFRWSGKASKTSDMAFLITPHLIGDEEGSSLVGINGLLKETAPDMTVEPKDKDKTTKSAEDSR